jgi:hypothetical protein
MGSSWRPRRRALLAFGAACCTAGAAEPPPAEVLRSLRIIDGTLAPEERLIAVQKDDRLRLRITSNLAGELHLHAYRLGVAVAPGQAAELAFTAHATGRFRIEWHPAAARADAPDAHHAPPLATLEVRPR